MEASTACLLVSTPLLLGPRLQQVTRSLPTDRHLLQRVQHNEDPSFPSSRSRRKDLDLWDQRLVASSHIHLRTNTQFISNWLPAWRSYGFVVINSGIQQCFYVFIDIYRLFLFLFHCYIWCEIKILSIIIITATITTTTITTITATTDILLILLRLPPSLHYQIK